MFTVDVKQQKQLNLENKKKYLCVWGGGGGGEAAGVGPCVETKTVCQTVNARLSNEVKYKKATTYTRSKSKSVV